MSDDQGIIIFLGIGVAVIALIVVVGLLSSRRKAKSARPAWSVAVQHLGDQPFLASSDVLLNDKRAWARFQEQYPLGAVVSVPIAHGNPEEPAPAPRDLHVSAVKRSLRAGWPTAKWGFTVYFAEYEGTDLPASFAVKGSKKIVAVALDAHGITAMDATEQQVWASPWSDLLFSNGTDLILRNTRDAVHLEVSTTGSLNELEELVIKYGTLKQMHF